MSQCTGLSQTLWSLFAQFHVFGWNSHVKPLALPIQHVSTPSGAALLENAIASEISARRRSSALRNSESVGKLEGIRHWLIINHKKNHIYIYIIYYMTIYHWLSVDIIGVVHTWWSIQFFRTMARSPPAWATNQRRSFHRQGNLRPNWPSSTL